MRRIPVIPTLIVGLAIAAMIGLGLWQLLIRLPEKEAYLAQLAANPARPPIAIPAVPDDRLLFRRAALDCPAPTGLRLAGAGAAGFRVIADCPARGDRVALAVQLGTTRDPMTRPRWRGGHVTGTLSHAPDARPLLAGLWDHRPRPLMLVADAPPPGLSPPGLSPNARPSLDAIPNSHLAYAGQWFFFALIAAVIYPLALRRRLSPPSPRI